jgi:hypothetical protein
MPTTLSAVPELDFDGRILFWRASCSVMTFRSAAPSARHLLLPVAPEVVVGEEPFSTPRKPVSWSSTGADDGIRTRDPNLGKVVLYQLSHVRAADTLPPETPGV